MYYLFYAVTILIGALVNKKQTNYNILIIFLIVPFLYTKR